MHSNFKKGALLFPYHPCLLVSKIQQNLIKKGCMWVIYVRFGCTLFYAGFEHPEWERWLYLTMPPLQYWGAYKERCTWGSHLGKAMSGISWARVVLGPMRHSYPRQTLAENYVSAPWPLECHTLTCLVILRERMWCVVMCCDVLGLVWI